MIEKIEKQFEKIPAFKPDTCKGCKGHANYILDCEYEKEGDRKLLVNVINNYTNDNKRLRI